MAIATKEGKRSFDLEGVDIKEKQYEIEAAIEEENTPEEGEKFFNLAGVDIKAKHHEIEAAIEEACTPTPKVHYYFSFKLIQNKYFFVVVLICFFLVF